MWILGLQGLKGLRYEDLLFSVNSMLKSLLSVFIHTQNAPVKQRGRYQMNFIMESYM